MELNDESAATAAAHRQHNDIADAKKERTMILMLNPPSYLDHLHPKAAEHNGRVSSTLFGYVYPTNDATTDLTSLQDAAA